MCCHILTSKACSKFAADVEAQPCYVMAGAGRAAGPAQDEHITNLQVTKVNVYCNNVLWLLAQWLRLPDAECEVLGSIPLLGNFLLSRTCAYQFVHLMYVPGIYIA
jgi:hypothetical protein